MSSPAVSSSVSASPAAFEPARLAPAREPPVARDRGRLLVLDPSRERFSDRNLSDLPQLLSAGDLLVLNDAATIPASLRARAGQSSLELRLLGQLAPARWQAVLFDGGDWQVPTERRKAPLALALGDVLELEGLRARVMHVSALSPRLLELVFDRTGDALWEALYRAGTPVQYSYQREALALWSVQTSYASRPWAVEMPSAGRPLSFRMLRELRLRGVQLATLTHAAGLSATGDPALDSALPLPERYEIPARTIAQIHRARARGRRVIAVGTSVMRALEGSVLARDGELTAGPGVTDLRIGRGQRLAVVDGLLSGVHVPGESHFELLCALAEERLWQGALAHASKVGYHAHEFGDSTLVLPSAAGEQRRGADASLFGP